MKRGEALGLLAEIAAHRRSRSPDRLAQRLGRVVAVAQLDLDRVGIDDQACGDVLACARQRGGGVLVGRGAGEIFAPAAGFLLEHDDPVDEPVGGDNLSQTKVLFAERVRK